MRRIIVFIIIFALFLAFIVVNLDAEHRSNVSIIFHTFEDVPVFLSVFFAFVLGMFFSIPLFLYKNRKKSTDNAPVKTKKPKKSAQKQDRIHKPSLPPKYIGEEDNDQIKKEESVYGID